jgi:enoyl-CoA hydratase
MSGPEELIVLSEHDRVATITIRRSEKRNALDHAMWARVATLAADLAERTDLRLLVLRGEGDHFSAGGDLAEMKALLEDVENVEQRLDAPLVASDALTRIPFPTLAVLRGSVMGGGCELALACDLRVADTTVAVGLPPSRVGLVYGARSTARLVATAGAPVARRMLLLGDPLPAAEAHAVGLIDLLVAPDELEATVDHVVATVLARSGSALRGMKEIIGRVERGLVDDDEASLALRHSSYRSRDFREGVRAFVERRAPRFE